MIITSFIYIDSTNVNNIYTFDLLHGKYIQNFNIYATNCKIEIEVDSTLYNVEYGYITNITNTIDTFSVKMPSGITFEVGKLYNIYIYDYIENNILTIDYINNNPTIDKIYIATPDEYDNIITGDNNRQYITYTFSDNILYSYKALSEFLFTISDTKILKSNIFSSSDGTTYTQLYNNVIVGSEDLINYNYNITDTQNIYYSLYIDTTSSIDNYINYENYNYTPIINSDILLKLYNTNDYNYYLSSNINHYYDNDVRQIFTIHNRKYMDITNKLNYNDHNFNIDITQYLDIGSVVTSINIFAGNGFFNDVDNNIYCIVEYENATLHYTKFISLSYNGTYNEDKSIYLPIKLNNYHIDTTVDAYTIRGYGGKFYYNVKSYLYNATYSYILYNSGIFEIYEHSTNKIIDNIENVNAIFMNPIYVTAMANTYVTTFYIVYVTSNNVIISYGALIQSDIIQTHNIEFKSIGIKCIYIDDNGDISILYNNDQLLTSVGIKSTVKYYEPRSKTILYKNGNVSSIKYPLISITSNDISHISNIGDFIILLDLEGNLLSYNTASNINTLFYNKLDIELYGKVIYLSGNIISTNIGIHRRITYNGIIDNITDSQYSIIKKLDYINDVTIVDVYNNIWKYKTKYKSSYIKDFIKYENEMFYFEFSANNMERSSIFIDLYNDDVYLQNKNINYFTDGHILDMNCISYIPLKMKDSIYLSKLNCHNNYINNIIMYNYNDINFAYNNIQFKKTLTDNYLSQYKTMYKTGDDEYVIFELDSTTYLYGHNNLELVKLNGDSSRLLPSEKLLNVSNKCEPIPKYKNEYYRLFDIDKDNILVDTNIKCDGTSLDVININDDVYEIVESNINNIKEILNNIDYKQVILIAKKIQTIDDKLKFYPSEIIVRKNNNIMEYPSELFNISIDFINTHYHLKRIILLENDKDIMMYIQK